MAINVEQQLENVTGWEMILHPNPEHQANEMERDLRMVIVAEPLAIWVSETKSLYVRVEAELKEKKRKRTPSEVEEEIEKDFSLMELYKKNDINEIISRCKEINVEADIDPHELLKNLKGWKVKITKRGGANGNERKDQFYSHEILSKRKLRSLVEVRKCIEKNSYPRKDLDSLESSKVELPKAITMGPKTPDEVESHEALEFNIKIKKSRSPVTCSKCHNQGHNSRTCKGLLA